MKVLVIKNGSDIDIITAEGGYAFSWVVDGIRKLDCYQERISEKLNPDDGLNEFLDGNKCYGLKDMDANIDSVYVLEKALDQLLMPGYTGVEARTEELGDRELEDLINEFLKIK